MGDGKEFIEIINSLLNLESKTGIHQFYINKDALVLKQLLENPSVKIEEKDFSKMVNRTEKENYKVYLTNNFLPFTLQNV